MGIKLMYFPLPGRAEPIRLLLAAGNVAFEDVRIPGADWPELKPTMPFGQMPVLEVDGVMVAQTAAILTYAAKISGFYPEDPLVAALADQAVCYMEEVISIFKPIQGVTDPEEKQKIVSEIAAGPYKEKAAVLSKLLDGKMYAAGDKPSHADLLVFCTLSLFKSGFMGFPTACLEDFPVLKEYRNRIASIDFVQKHYADVTEGMLLAFQPEP